MSKSYSPTKPKPRKNQPEWAKKHGRRWMLLRTDDMEAHCLIVANHPHRKNRLRVAYRDGRGRWYELEVERRRVKEVA